MPVPPAGSAPRPRGGAAWAAGPDLASGDRRMRDGTQPATLPVSGRQNPPAHPGMERSYAGVTGLMDPNQYIKARFARLVPLRTGSLAGMALATALLLAAEVSTLDAQVAGRGSLAVTVVDRDDFPLQGVSVRVSTAEDEGGEREITTSSSGVAHFYYLEAQPYTLNVERLGYVPLRVRLVEITPGERAQLRIELRESPPPITEIDEVVFSRVGTQRAPPGARILGAPPAPRPIGLLDPAGVFGLGSASSFSGGALPLRYLRLEVEGVPVATAWSTVGGPGMDDLGAFHPAFMSRASLRRSAVVSGGTEGPGPLLDLQSPSSRSRASGRVTLGAGLTDGEGTDAAGGTGAVAPQFSAVISTPLMGDTVRLVTGLAFERWTQPSPTLLAPSSLAAESLDGLAGSTVAMTLPSAPRLLRERNVVSGFSRLDWATTPSTSLMLQVHGAMLPEVDPILSPPLPEGQTLATSGADLFASSRFLYTGGDGVAVEVNVGAGRSGRVTGTGIAGDTDRRGIALLAPGAFAGSFRDASGEMSLTTLSLSPVATFAGDNYQFRAGGIGKVRGWQDERASRIEERVLFANASHAAASGAARGLRRSFEHASRDVSTRHRTLALFTEARWWFTPSFRVTVEGRVDLEYLPRDELRGNPLWADLTGIESAGTGEDRSQWSPGGELRWEPADLPGWSVTLSGRRQPGEMDPSLMGTIVSEWAPTLARIGVTPSVRSEGRQFHLLGPNFRAPRGEVFVARVEGRLFPTLRVGLDAFQHQSDFLPRRRDLNRSPGSGVMDQFGRSHVGTLLRQDGLIVIRPGSDRRFQEFDEVWAVEADGWARTRGLALGATWEAPGLLLEGNYTASSTTDNAPFGLSGLSSPLTGSLGPTLGDADWVEGRSDHDRPHRVSLLGIAELPLGPETRVSWNYRITSGRPFSAGVRDALGFEWEEGWTRLQPVALPDGQALPRSGDGWSCDLSTSTSGRLERNGCRGSAVHTLDLRLDLGLPAMGGHALSLKLEALNLLDQVEVLRDPALVVVDGSRDFSLDAAGTRVALPVLENATFGEPLARLPGGRSLRFGIEYRF
ncbi:MAG: carboxypeptidase regulatory-like domain-containing protein [Gemmatimonadales bacterium]|nr:MAG: carboxypeptidase regulatory-like domain-containing protein [Gemmatimonadales bacterium]